MDVCESNIALHKHASVEKLRPPLVPAERNNAVTSTHRPRTRDVPSRYKSPSPSTLSAPSPRRCSSPYLSRTATTPTPSQAAPKRALSAERKRPSTPTSPQRPSTPVQDSSVDMHMSSRKVVTGRLAESLWPSTMRSLSVSFQSDIISIPVAKKEKPVSNASIDRTLRPSSNAAVRQAETPTAARKTTPERKRSPLKGKNVSDRSENSKPVDTLSSRLIDQHRWPSRVGGKVSSSNAVNCSTDLGDKITRNPTTMAGVGLSSVKRVPSSDGPAKHLQKSSSDAARLLVNAIDREDIEGNSFEDKWAGFLGQNKLVSSNVADRGTALTPAIRSRSLPSSRQPSPSRTVSSSLSRGVSPSSSRPSTPPSRGVSPSRIRASATSTQSITTPSVLSFIVDFRKGKKSSVYIEDAHQLRLLYNRYLQWRSANARAEAALHNQKVKAEETMYNVWKATLTLAESVIKKRILLQQMRLELKLNSVLNGQMAYLDEWASLERDHIISLAGAVEDLEASTLRLPVTGGARADIETLKVVLHSSLDVMQVTGTSVHYLFSRIEKMNELVTELALVAAHERAMLGECEALLGSAAAMQIEEHSLRIHITQLKQALEKGRTRFWQLNTNKDSTLSL